MADRNTVRALEEKALEIRRQLIHLACKTAIHIGGDLSSTDLMTAIWQHALRYDAANPAWEGRDRFVLSKGHAAAVTTLNQALKGCYSMEEVFNEYGADNGRFGMHSCNLINPHVEVSTGSLGHGLPVAAGMAAALRMKGSQSRVYVVMGDGEQHEGTIWEAAMSAPHFGLGNLIAFVDRNRMSLEGPTEQIMRLEPFADKWRAFGWRVIEVDGHDMAAWIDALDGLPEPGSDVPTVFIANTLKGKGVAFMEDQAAWHIGRIDPQQCQSAIEELEETFRQKWGA